MKTHAAAFARLSVPRVDGTTSRSRRIELTFGRALAGVCVLFGGQAFPIFLQQAETMHHGWAWTLGPLMFAVLLVAVVTGIAGRGAQKAAAAVPIVYLALLVTWPFVATNLQFVLPGQPWLWYLLDVAAAAAAVAFRELLAIGYTLLVVVGYLLVRLTPAGGAAGVKFAAVDSGYAFIIGITIVLIVMLLRRSARNVDRAESSAVVRYTSATKAHAAEVERVEVDALLHDTVMAGLLVASRSFSIEERRYSTALARKALDVISMKTGAPSEGPVSLEEVTQRFSAMCRELGIEATFTATGLENTEVPASISETFFAASLQAMMNSVEHAGDGPVQRAVTATWADDELTVTLSDDGVGFDATKASERLGIRKSIVERVESVGGRACIESAPGKGTLVTLTWALPGR